MNIENFDKVKVITRKILVLKSFRILDFCYESYIPEIEKLAFHLPHIKILGKIIVQVKYITCLWFNTIILTVNPHVIIHKYVRHLLNKFTHNTYLSVSPFLWRGLVLSTLTNWNHPPYIWHNSVLVYLTKFIHMLALLRHIFVFFFNFLLQNKL